MKRKILLKTLIGTFILTTFININVFANTPVVYTKISNIETITKGLTYETINKLTPLGPVKINVLKADLTDPNIQLQILKGNTWGTSDTVSNMTKISGAVAGVNASFFYTDIKPTEPIGMIYENENFDILKQKINKEKFEANQLIVAKDNSVTIGYIQSNTLLKNSKGDTVSIVSINGWANIINNTLITSNIMKDSSEIESLGDIYKFVIEDNKITKIVPPKEIAQVPEDGYVLTVNSGSADDMSKKFPVGEPINLIINTTNDQNMENTNLIVSGGGTILKNGEIKADGIQVQPKSRVARTAVGTTADGKNLIIMTIDAKSVDSIGATKDEVGAYLLELGVNNAMHFDGGGSTAMAVRHEDTDTVTLSSRPSDGKERKVINGFGVKDTSTGILAQLKVTPRRNIVPVGEPIGFDIVGQDENKNPAPFDLGQVTYEFTNEDGTPANGTWDGQAFIPNSGDLINLICTYGEKKFTTTFNVMTNIMNIEANNGYITLKPNSKKNIDIVATDEAGNRQSIGSKNIIWTVTPETMGVIKDGIFYSNDINVDGTISAEILGKKVITNVSVGSTVYPLSSFENEKLTTKPYPDKTIEGSVIKSTLEHSDGLSSVNLTYNFKDNGVVQAIYGVLDNPSIIYDSKASKLSLDVLGDNSGVAVKAYVTDSNGKEIGVSFTDNVDFTGFKKLDAQIPSNLKFPIKIERLYVASKGDKNIKGSVYIDNLTYNGSNKSIINLIKLDGDSQYTDEVATDFKMTVVPKSGANPAVLNSSNLVVMPFDDKNITAKKILWNNNFTSNSYSNTKIITIGANNGSIIETDSVAWSSLIKTLNNASQKNVVIVSTQLPQPVNTFKRTIEGQSLHEYLVNYQKRFGKNIYFVNINGGLNKTSYVDGIRYVSLQNKSIDFYLDENQNLKYSSK